jgi:hypothetical protein
MLVSGSAKLSSMHENQDPCVQAGGPQENSVLAGALLSFATREGWLQGLICPENITLCV